MSEKDKERHERLVQFARLALVHKARLFHGNCGDLPKQVSDDIAAQVRWLRTISSEELANGLLLDLGNESFGLA